MVTDGAGPRLGLYLKYKPATKLNQTRFYQTAPDATNRGFSLDGIAPFNT